MISPTPGPGTPSPAGPAGRAGWMLFDWASQPFFTVVTTFVFGPYFVAWIASDPASGQAMWGYAASAAGLVIAVFSPVLGSIADSAGPRKPWIVLFGLIQVAAMTALWWAVPGINPLWPLVFFAIATVCAEFAIVFNDSMMPALFARANLGKVSNLAWGLGYLGGMVMLIIVLAFFAASPETGRTLVGLVPAFGLDAASHAGDRACGPLAAIWYAVFILPLLVFTPDTPRAMAISRAVAHGLGELRDTIVSLHQRAALARFLVARMVYQDGLTALLLLGGAFAAGMFGWRTIEIGVYGIILNVTAIAGNLVAGRIDARHGSKAVVMGALATLVVATCGIISTGPGFTAFGMVALPLADSGGLYGTAAEKVYIVFGLLIGLAFGPVQASSRSFLAFSVDESESGKFFGLYALAGRATSFLAPFMVASVTAASGSARLGMAVIIVFFVAGMALLAFTPYRGAKARPA